MRTKVKLISDKPSEYITLDSIVDGPGLRFVVWFQGCQHACPGCHNPQTQSFAAGEDVEIIDVKKEIKKICDEGIYDGITFSGGDPLYQIDALSELTQYCKELGLNVWVYTGFVYEKIPNFIKNKMQYIDVLVEGPFILKQKSFDCLYRGSTNQRIIDIQKTLIENKLSIIEF